MNLVPIVTFWSVFLLLPGGTDRTPGSRDVPRAALGQTAPCSDSRLTPGPADGYAPGDQDDACLQTTLGEEEAEEDLSTDDTPDLDLLAFANLGAGARADQAASPRPPCGFGPFSRVHPLRC